MKTLTIILLFVCSVSFGQMLDFDNITATTIKLKRGSASAFKSTDYDATSYNRGYIVLIYKR